MLSMIDEIGILASHYIMTYGRRAEARLSDDLSRAQAAMNCRDVYRLQRAKLRLYRYELAERNIAELGGRLLA